MTKEEWREISELKELLKGFIDNKFDPDNGWKTNRAVFESSTIDKLQNIDTKIDTLKECVKKLPELKNTVDNIQEWRQRTNKVLLWIGMTVGSPILGGIGYLLFKALAK